MITVKIFLFKGRNEESNIRELYEYYKKDKFVKLMFIYMQKHIQKCNNIHYCILLIIRMIPFRMQKVAFRSAKGGISECKSYALRQQKHSFRNAKRMLYEDRRSCVYLCNEWHRVKKGLFVLCLRLFTVSLHLTATVTGQLHAGLPAFYIQPSYPY